MLFSLAGPSFFLSDDYSYTFQGHLSLSSCHFFIHLIVYLLGFLILVLLPPLFKKCFSSFSFVLCHFNFSFLGVSFTFSTGPPTLVSFSWFLISYFFPLQLSVLLYYFGLCVNFSFVSFSWFTFFFCRGGFFHFLSSGHPFFWHSFSCILEVWFACLRLCVLTVHWTYPSAYSLWPGSWSCRLLWDATGRFKSAYFTLSSQSSGMWKATLVCAETPLSPLVPEPFGVREYL